MIHRPALRYYGGKFKIADWVISNFPDHITYVEPFAGGSSVMLCKEPSKAEVLNDLDENVINYFRILRERPLDLKRLIDFTPFSRGEVYLACEPTDDPLERARRFHVRSWQTMHGAPHMGRNGWRFKRGGRHDRTPAVDWNDTARLPAIAARLKEVMIEHDDALAVIRRFDAPSTLFYCDPPYVRASRSDRWARCGYRLEMDDEGHRALAELLHQVKGMAVISGYQSELYDRLYRGWLMRSKTAYSAKNQKRTEVLWVSPNAQKALRQLEIQIPGGGRKASSVS